MANYCKVCGAERNGFVCGVCEYEEEFFSEAPTVEEVKALEKEIDAYRKTCLKAVKMRVPVYDYRKKIHMDNRQLSIDAPIMDSIEIKGEALKPEEICWFDEDFANLACDYPLDCEIVDRKGKGIPVKETLKKPPVEGDTLRIGLKLLKGFKACVVVGEDGKTSESATIQL